MTIFIWLVSLWAAISFIIAVISFFQDDHKVVKYNYQVAGCVGIAYFFIPILVPLLRFDDWLTARKEKRDVTNGNT